MSNKGIYTALSGAIAQSKRLDTIANNIANVNTNSFKKDKQVFNEYLTAYEKQPDVLQVPRVPASVESFYDMQGGDRGYVDANGTFTDFTQGAITPTGNSLDVAIEGEGFFEVLTPQGVRYTRNGSFKRDAQGRLVTSQGFLVLKQGQGQAPAQRAINLENQNVTISYGGQVFQDDELLGSLSVVTPDNKDAFRKIGNSLYTLKENFQPQLQNAENIKLHQGFVEKSNVNIIAEMTDMISATRAFESTQKAIKAFDQMNGKLVNDVPKT